MDLTICTSCWNYGKYIPDWWDGIKSQTKKPKAISFFNNASTDNTKKIAEKIGKEAEKMGIRFIYTESEEKLHFGVARNRSIEPAETEWVCHFDTDDKMLPNFVKDASANKSGCDVVAVGYQAFGGSTRVKTYPKGRTPKQVLDSGAPCSPVAPFKKSLWEQSPYNEQLKSSWDTGLWIGFAHLGARFGATDRPGYLYRVHPDSIFMSKGPVEGKRIGLDLSALRIKAVPLVSIIIPHRPVDKYREKNFETVTEHLSKNNLWEILSGDCEGEWNKGKIFNELSRQAKGRVLVFHDNDVMVDDMAFYRSVEKVLHGASWAIPHTMVHREARNGEGFDREPYKGVEGGGAFVIQKNTWFAVGGFDEAFQGWGGEDIAFGLCCRAMFGAPHREGAPLKHLWHPPQPDRSGGWGKNGACASRYWSNRGNKYGLIVLAEKNRQKNFPGVTLPYTAYICTDLKHLERMEVKFGEPPDFIYAGKSPMGFRKGVIKTCIPKNAMLQFPCVKQITDSEFNEIIKTHG